MYLSVSGVEGWTWSRLDIRYVKEPIFVLVFFVDATHERSCGWQDFVHEDENGLLRRKLDALADDVNELPDSEVGWYEIFLLVDGRDIRFLDFLANHLFTRGEVSRSNRR